MSTPGDIEARARAIHAARAEVDEMLGFGPVPEPAPRITPTAVINARRSTWEALTSAARDIIESVEGSGASIPAVEAMQEALAGLAACDPSAAVPTAPPADRD